MIGEQTHNVNNFIYVNKNIYIVFIDINNFIYVNKKISNQKMIITFFFKRGSHFPITKMCTIS